MLGGCGGSVRRFFFVDSIAATMAAGDWGWCGWCLSMMAEARMVLVAMFLLVRLGWGVCDLRLLYAPDVRWGGNAGLCVVGGAGRRRAWRVFVV